MGVAYCLIGEKKIFNLTALSQQCWYTVSLIRSLRKLKIRYMEQFFHWFYIPGSLLPHCGGGWSGGGGVLSRCTGRLATCRKLPGGCCPMIFSRLLLRTSTFSTYLIWLNWCLLFVCILINVILSLFIFMWPDTVPDVNVLSAWFHITTSFLHCFVQITLDELCLVKHICFWSNSYIRCCCEILLMFERTLVSTTAPSNTVTNTSSLLWRPKLSSRGHQWFS